jgi:DNA-3-methyladenine glycosylase I
VGNARIVAELGGELDGLLWSFAPDTAGRAAPVRHSDVPASTPESAAMARELKRRGFRFVGPTTCYALMQATGMVDDHLAGCWRRS